jgi:hypothetical protein
VYEYEYEQEAKEGRYTFRTRSCSTGRQGA